MTFMRRHHITRVGVVVSTAVFATLAAVAAGRAGGAASAGPYGDAVPPIVPPTLPPPETTTTTASPSTTTTAPPPPPAPVVEPKPDPPPHPQPSGLRTGDRGPGVQDLQRRLTALGYWNGAADGAYGLITEQAVMAFQKVHRMPRTGQADAKTLAALAQAGRPKAASASGDLIEIDKARQVIFIVRGGAVRWTLNTSTGTEKRYRTASGWALADTPVGRWTITRSIDGNRRAELGTLYRPRYFHDDGIAIHGAREIPGYPASHGCARVSNAAMDWIWANDLAPIGSTVWVR